MFSIHFYMKESTIKNSNSDLEWITSEHVLFPSVGAEWVPGDTAAITRRPVIMVTQRSNWVSSLNGSGSLTPHRAGGGAFCRGWAMSSRELAVHVCFLCLPITGSEWGWIEVNAVINQTLAAFPCKINLHPLCWVINRLKILRPCTLDVY